ncbi:type IV toxin-antitoxin system AbiEi family antitoxin domain-containing protein [Pseudomonas mosselii]|uniref:type IV toxin-antitoxin system AbiEi family antitoxin n=1 Tax=unclassified Pseudomonas TaxID=196821 RepID=UPI001F15C658|nr:MULTISPECIES: type IV toxin-antitoxin system AbiEi family antitoxin domain-containing protein [unclassified Pseudomonas]MCF1486203.1 type IV toxin-antitoxin system AbiEi family antitoxin domain-containing protein [Pseudomonas sp. AA27]MCP8634355.1 type IV toxin-antitoxin system AbiEi family antitoxin domain-containing protein [Pseudomonas sp. DVZ6]MDD7784600.1 type IV toxin-antitoxin system AbiEi family antitoxin domain-containing protein [Pseudomonas sp. DVZ24]
MPAQPLQCLYRGLHHLATPQRYLFTPADMRALVPGLSDGAYRSLLSRASNDNILIRVCRGLYLFTPAKPNPGLVLYHAAARLRADNLNYISLECALSDIGVISQVPQNWLTIMSSGRSQTISCAAFGTVEFVHTTRTALELNGQLDYDDRCRLWRAKASLALADMKRTRRNLELIDWKTANELV